MDVPWRYPDVRHSGYNQQTNESERCQVPGQTAGNTRHYMPSRVPSTTQNQVPKTQVPTQVPGSALNKVPNPFPNSVTPGRSTSGDLPFSAACNTQNNAFRNNVSSESRRHVQAATTLPSEDRAAATFRSVYRDCIPDCAKFGQQVSEIVFTDQSNRYEGARDFRTVGDHQKIPDARNAVGYTQIGLGEKTANYLNYINPTLVQKVLECQKKRAQTPTSHLRHSIKEAPLVGLSAGRRIPRFKKPEHHSSDVSLSNKMADCRVADPETVSTESQKESGYQSGDSVGDRSSENNELGRITRWPTAPSVAQPFPAIPGTPDGQCERYFLKGDHLMDLCNEQENSGNWPQALIFLNQAIDFFQHAINLPGASHENLLRMRLKHNRAVLHRRKLMKQAGCSTEPTNRRLPCPPQEVKGSLSTDTFSQHHQAISDRHKKLPIGADCDGNTRNGGYLMENSSYPDDVAGKFICGSDRIGGNVSLVAGNPCLPESGQHWTSDDVKDIKIYATLPKNRSRKGPLVTDAQTFNPVQNKLKSEISMVCQNQESRHQSEAVNQRKNTSEYRTSDGGRKCQQVPNCYGTSGMMYSREPETETLHVEGKFLVPDRARQMPYSDGQWMYDSLSRDFAAHNVDMSKMGGSTSDPTKFVRF